jgi:hypothetical protein
MEEITGDWKKLYEELPYLYISLYIIILNKGR